jgi:hypothetical protein
VCGGQHDQRCIHIEQLVDKREEGDAPNLRVLPAFVMNLVLEAALLVTLVDRLHIEHLGLVQQLMVKTERLFIFLELWLWDGSGRHDCAGQ